jgi:predicted MFS family arabinose efflux permease
MLLRRRVSARSHDPGSVVRTARITLPGIALVATTFGLARYGYGLLVPEMRRSFGLDATTVGLLASGAYVTYLAATAASISLVARHGPRRIAILAGLLAAIGMVIIGRAASVPVLALGIVVAGASSGLAFPPFADFAAAHLDPERRGGALAAISSGTGWGVALAAPVAIVAGHDWRAAWLAFAGIAVVVSVTARLLLPQVTDAVHDGQAPHLDLRWFLCPRSRPLLISAFLVGLSASVYWTFGPDAVQSAQGATISHLLFVVVGIASIGGAFANQILRRLGTALGFRLCGALLACSLALLIVGASRAPIAIASGLVFGITYNLVVAIQVIWSDEVFASRPSAGLAATMLMFGTGQILGPTIAGIVADRAGVGAAFGLAAGVMAVSLSMAPPVALRSAPLAASSA